MKKYYTTKQVARILQIDIAKVYEYIKINNLKAYRLGGNGTSKRHWRISENDLEQFILGVHNVGSIQDKRNQNIKNGNSNLSIEPIVQ